MKLFGEPIFGFFWSCVWLAIIAVVVVYVWHVVLGRKEPPDIFWYMR